MNAVFLDFATMGAEGIDRSPLADALPGIEFFDATAPGQRLGRIRNAAWVLTNKVRIDRELVDAARDLRFIGLTATGTDNIDLEAAAGRGIAVCNIRAYCTQSVVEHVFAVLLNLAHSIGAFDRDVRNGEWQRAADFCMLGHPIRQLSARTRGIVGYGWLGAPWPRRRGISACACWSRGGAALWRKATMAGRSLPSCCAQPTSFPCIARSQRIRAACSATQSFAP